MENVGLFLCTGCDIGKAVNTEDFEEVATEHGATSYAAHECLCSPEGVKLIHDAIDDGSVDTVVIAACSQRVKMEEFFFDPTKVASFRVGLREQVAWTQEHGHEDTQMLAEDLIRMGCARGVKLELTEPSKETIDRTVLVVGGGVAGLNAAKAAAGLGHPVVLIEAEAELGGSQAKIKDAVPEAPPYDRLHPNKIGDLIAEVKSQDDLRVLTGTTTKLINGQPGQFDVTLSGPKGEETLKIGAIVQATGGKPYDISKLEHLGGGTLDDVVSSTQLDSMITEGKLKRPSDSKEPKRIVFVQCAGSRDPDHLPYCSADCCSKTLRQVAAVHRDFPEVECAVVYRDLRAPGQLEHFYLGVQEQPRSLFTRGDVEKVEGDNGKLKVQLKDSLLGAEVTVEADMVVLATGMVPNSADGESIRILTDAKAVIEKNESKTQVENATKVVEEHQQHEGTEILNLNYRQGPDLPTLSYAFADSHYICFPYETRRTGIYTAGTVHAPMDVAQAAEDGWGAAMKAVQCIVAAENGKAVHPRAGDASIASFFLQRCTQCKRCTEECPFGAINEDEKGTPEYNLLRCRRCGICLGACPERIISFPEYSVDGVGNMIKAMEVPEEDEEKPRMVAIMCENDALPALDEAAARRLKLSPWMRIIPVRCLGAVNLVWIADSLSRGIDGLILIGCKKGDDYQCHYIKGSELAATRMENVKETLDRLSLESERVKIVELARDEYDRLPQIFEEFAETIEEVGPNPYKGF